MRSSAKHMRGVLPIYGYKSKCWPERFGFRTAGIESDPAIERPCVFKDVKRYFSANPAPPVGRPDVEPPHAQPATIYEVLRNAAYSCHFTTYGSHSQYFAWALEAIEAITPLLLKQRHVVETRRSGFIQELVKLRQFENPPNLNSVAVSHHQNSNPSSAWLCNTTRDTRRRKGVLDP